MKKYLIILLALALGAGLYVYLDPELNRKLSQQLRTPLPAAQQHTLYKWQDAQGQWQVTDRPPPDGIAYEKLQYDPQTNVIPAEQITGRKPAR